MKFKYTEESEAVFSFFNTQDEPDEVLGNCSRFVYTFNDLGFRNGLYFLKKDNQRLTNSWGIYEYKWDQGLCGKYLLHQESLNLLFDGSPNQYGGYGYGFKIKPYKRNNDSEGKLVRLGGSMYGFIYNIHSYMDDQVTIIVLGNIRPYPVMEITEKIEKILLDNSYFSVAFLKYENRTRLVLTVYRSNSFIPFQRMKKYLDA